MTHLIYNYLKQSHKHQVNCYPVNLYCLFFQLIENKVSDLLELHLYVTREKNEDDAGKLPTWHVGSPDIWTPGKVNYGRPNFRQEIAKKVESHIK